MEYVLKIRDLSNESAELKRLVEDYKIDSENLRKDISIKADSHFAAITSYLKHFQLEAAKIMRGVDKIEVNRNGCLYICITAYKVEISTEWDCLKYKYTDDFGFYNDYYKKTFQETDNSEYYILNLIKNWDSIKTFLDTELQKILNLKCSKMQENIGKLNQNKAIMDNFKI